MATSTPITVFTDELSAALAELRTLVTHVGRRDTDLQQRLQDALGAVTGRMEEQVLLMFENFALVDKQQEIQLLQRDTHAAIDRARSGGSGRQSPAPDETGKTRADSDIVGNDSLSMSQTFPTEPPDMRAPSSLQRTRDRQGRTDKRKAAPLELAQRHLSTALYLALEALAAVTKAERCVVYVHHKTTGVLKSVCGVPHAMKRLQVSGHSGLLGLSFTSGVAFNLRLNDDDRATYTKPIDTQLGVTTNNIMCFPIRNERQVPVGVLELSNKMHGTLHWTELDESVAFHMAPILGYFLTHYDHTDFLAVPPFDPTSSLGSIEPWAPCMEDHFPDVPVGVKATDGSQLVFRNGAHSELASGLRAFREQLADKAVSLVPTGSLKEVHSYLVTLEETYRQGLNQYAQSEKERQKQQEEIQRRGHKIRILEDNVAYLEDIIKELKAHAENAAAAPRESPGHGPASHGPAHHGGHKRSISRRFSTDPEIGRDKDGAEATLHNRRQPKPPAGPARRPSANGSQPPPDGVRRVTMMPATRDPPSPVKGRLPAVPTGRSTSLTPDAPLTPATLSKFLRAKDP